MTTVAPWAGAFLAAFAVAYGYVLHELSHYVVARALGRNPQINWRAAETVWPIPESGPDWRDRLITRAPVIKGMLFAVGQLLGGSVPLPLVFLVPFWLTFTFGGVVGELWGGQSDLTVETTVNN